MTRWWLIAVVLVGVGALAVGIVVVAPALGGSTEVEYLTATAETADVTAEVAATGTVQPAVTYNLRFGADANPSKTVPASGGESADPGADTGSDAGVTGSITWPVTSLEIAVGDHVTEGDTLATADTADLDADITVAAAQVDAAEAQVDAAVNDQAAANAKAQLLDAQRNLEELQAARALATLVAPADGQVVEVNITEGAAAPSGTAIAIASDVMVATASVTEADVSAIAIGQGVTVTLSASGDVASGEVSYVSPVGSSSGGVVAFGILVTLDEAPDAARPGMSADVTVLTAEAADVLAVPTAAVDGSTDAYTVTVMNVDGTLEERDVAVGLVTDDLTEITSGLSAGETVVTGTASTQQTTTDGGFNFGGGLGPPGGGFQGPPGAN